MQTEFFEGFFIIPHQGQIRFKTAIVNGFVAFQNADRSYDHLFNITPATINYDETTDDVRKKVIMVEVMRMRQMFLLKQSSVIRDFILSGKTELKTDVSFIVRYLSMQYTETGRLEIHRIQKLT